MKQRFTRMLLFSLFVLVAAGCSRSPTEPELEAVTHPNMPTHAQLKAALKGVVDGQDNGGFGLQMWATTVDRDGVVTNVAFSGDDRGSQWPGSRVISAQKANTANAFSLPGLALSTANIFTATQPGGSLSGLQFSNPVDTDVAYRGNPRNYGQRNDPMKGGRIGGVNVFGGGLALYSSSGELIGALGVSGDSSCADHNIAWKLRHALELDYVPFGISETDDDNIIYDIEDGKSESGFGHPECSPAATEIGEGLPVSHPIGAGATSASLSSTSVTASREMALENFRRGLLKLGLSKFGR